MARLVIKGRRRLKGEVRIGGSKNSSVAIIPAVLLGEGPSTLENVPAIRDVKVFAQILQDLGALVSLNQNTMMISPNGFASHVAPYGLVRNCLLYTSKTAGSPWTYSQICRAKVSAKI